MATLYQFAVDKRETTLKSLIEKWHAVYFDTHKKVDGFVFVFILAHRNTNSHRQCKDAILATLPVWCQEMWLHFPCSIFLLVMVEWRPNVCFVFPPKTDGLRRADAICMTAIYFEADRLSQWPCARFIVRDVEMRAEIKRRVYSREIQWVYNLWMLCLQYIL